MRISEKMLGGRLLRLVYIAAACLAAGCHQEGQEGLAANVPAGQAGWLAPGRVVITPLTRLEGPAGQGGIGSLAVYLRVTDAFGCDMKAPGVFRFELYQMVTRSGEPRGSRLAIWPDLDLTDPAENHRYWHQTLRLYVFHLDLAVWAEGPYVLEATMICPSGRRLVSQYILGASK